MSDMDKIDQPVPQNPAVYLKDKWTAADAVNKLLRGEDSAVAITAVLNELSHKHGMDEIVVNIGDFHGPIHNALNPDTIIQPRFDTIHKVLNALGFELMVVPVAITPVWPK